MKYLSTIGNRSIVICCIFVTGLVLSGVDVYAQGTGNGYPPSYPRGYPQRIQDLPAGAFRSRLESLPPSVQRRAIKWLQDISFPREDVAYLNVTDAGEIWYADSFLPQEVGDTQPSGPTFSAAIPSADIFKLHSRPGALKVLFLDFDGMTITGTAWNQSAKVSTFVALPFDPSGNDSPKTVANFTAVELDRIGEIWHRISEDYAPFDIDVTTEEPAVFNSQTGRVLFTQDRDANGRRMPAYRAGGVAYVDVFGDYNYHTFYSPALVYWNNLGSGYPTYTAEAGAHEFGHNIAMGHDGAPGSSYYSGHGSPNVDWAPIMGVGYGKNVTQWSKGEYPNANNTEDDLALIAAKLAYRPDDHGNSSVSATPLVVEPNGNIIVSDPELDPQNVLPFNKGVIGDRNDVDWFYFDSGSGTVNISAIPAWHAFPRTSQRGANLDIQLTLYNSALSQIDLDDPGDDTFATVSVNMSAGRYYLRVDGGGNNSFSNYSDYGSLGMYFIEGSVPPTSSDNAPPTPNPMTWAVNPVATGSSSITMTATTASDSSGVVLYEFVCLAGGSGCTSSGWQSGTQYNATNLAPNTQYTFTVRAKDNFGNTTGNSTQKSATTNAAANQNPTAAFSYHCVALACTFTDLSNDPDGSIVSRSWNFGDGGGSSSQNPSHTFATGNTYTVSLAVTDNQGGTDSTSQNVTVSSGGGGPVEVFFDSFENGAWNGLWTEDAQNDWFTSSSRATAGSNSAQVTGWANNAELISVPINLQGGSQATITFKWLIESSLDGPDYMAFDVSTDGGSSWTEKASLHGDVDPEDSWQPVQVDLSGISSLRLRFRGRMNLSSENANVDEVKVVAQ